MTYPLPQNEEQRLEELRRYAVLDTPPEKAFDNITELAARIFKVPISTVTLIDEDRQWFKSCLGLETREVGRNIAFCAHAILRDEVMVVPDAREDARFAENPLVTGAPHIRFYAGAPLRTSAGLNLGTLCIIDTKPRRITKANIATLAGLAALVVDEIQLRYEIGQRRRAAESLRLLEAAMQQSSESVMVTTAEVDLPGPEIIFVNPAFTSVTGYSAEEVIGKTPRILQGPKTERSVLDGVRTRLSKGEEFHGEAVNYRKDGSEFLVSWNISPIRDETGKVTHFIGFQRDATERNRAAAAVQEAKEEAERANRAKSEFLSRMSHELRTPLNGILGFAQVLEMNRLEGQPGACVAQILKAGHHLLALINEVLDLSGIEAGRVSYSIEAVRVHEVVLECIDLIRPLAAGRDLELTAPEPGALEGFVLADRQRLKQVVLNLLANAVKYNRAGGSVKVSAQEQGDDRLRINVEDTGHGIAEEKLERLFAPFDRLGADLTEVEGTGLGLALSKSLMQAMGGAIGVESIPGAGSTFWMELTRTSDPVARLEESDTTAAASAPLASGTLLYIEDNLSNLTLIEYLLTQRPGIKLLAAMQGRLGIELARQHRPDLILLDLHLPDIMGDKVLAELKNDPATRDIPVAILTADANPAQETRLLAAGADEFFTKPVDVPRLLRLIEETLRRRRAEDLKT